jgi:hypothetical protein
MKMAWVGLCSLSIAFGAAAAHADDALFPAGSIISCTVAEGKISSKTTAIGDPVLCTLNPVEKYGRSQFPYGSYLEGRFEAYKDPGHFVGKGWMELKFDRLFIGNRVVPISAKVISVPGYKVASDGRVLGNGHAVRDTIEWLIPVLWPIDLINLPRRGPRPVIKPETRLTLELMDDLGLPDNDIGYAPQQVAHQSALIERVPAQQQQQAYQQPVQQQPAPPQQVIYQNFQQAPAQSAAPQAPQVVYQPVYQPPVVVQSPPQVVYRYVPVPTAPPPPVYVPYGYRYYGPGY